MVFYQLLRWKFQWENAEVCSSVTVTDRNCYLCVGTWFCVMCESTPQQKISVGGTLSQRFVYEVIALQFYCFHFLFFWFFSVVVCSLDLSLDGPVQAVGRNAPLIRLLILMLYILFTCLYHMLPTCPLFVHYFLTYLYLYLSFLLRIDPLCFQVGCPKRRLNLALVFVFILCCSTFLLIGECMLLLC